MRTGGRARLGGHGDSLRVGGDRDVHRPQPSTPPALPATSPRHWDRRCQVTMASGTRHDHDELPAPHPSDPARPARACWRRWRPPTRWGSTTASRGTTSTCCSPPSRPCTTLSTWCTAQTYFFRPTQQLFFVLCLLAGGNLVPGLPCGRRAPPPRRDGPGRRARLEPDAFAGRCARSRGVVGPAPLSTPRLCSGPTASRTPLRSRSVCSPSRSFAAAGRSARSGGFRRRGRR